jgi:hypothetical protein
MSSLSQSIATMKKKTATMPHVPAPTQRETMFKNATSDMLDEARGVVENATGQGQMLDPMIYQMLGIQPQYQDNSAELQQSQASLDSQQKQLDDAQQTMAQLQSVPKGRRSPAQNKQLRQLKKQIPNLQTAYSKTQTAHGNLMTSQKTITGLSRLDPSQIPADSPFSSANPLNQAQATEEQRLNQYLAGSAPGAVGTGAAAVDPTLVHQYDAAESALRAKLEQRYGPDYENSSVGQMALQNFSRQKNEAYATWNQQQVEKYNSLAFTGQANLQQLLSNRIGMMREPQGNEMSSANALANVAGARGQQESLTNQMLLGRAGQTTTATNPMAPLGAGVGAASSLANWAVSPSSTGGPSPVSQLGNWMRGGGSESQMMGPTTGNEVDANAMAAANEVPAGGMSEVGGGEMSSLG